MISKISFCFVFALLISLQDASVWSSLPAIQNLERTEEVPEIGSEIISIRQALRFKRTVGFLPQVKKLGIFLVSNPQTKFRSVYSKYPAPGFNHFSVLRS